MNCLHRYEAVHAVKRFLRLTQEPVILDFHRFAIKSNLPKLFRFPFGFDGDDQAARHEDLVRYLQVHWCHHHRL